MKIVLFIAVFGTLLAIAVAGVAYIWLALEGTEMSTHGLIAMVAGLGLAFLLGVALMSLLFYSSRHGHDEPHRREDDDR